MNAFAKSPKIFVRQGYIRDVKPELPQRMLAEFQAWPKWHAQEVRDHSHFEHASCLRLRDMGLASAHFEQWVLSDGMDWLQRIAGHRLSWTHEPTATRWKPGDYLAPHKDGTDVPIWTLTIFLSQLWQPHWGGNLHIFDSWNDRWLYVPSDFDRLAFFCDQTHFVSQIATYCPETRYAITGWLKNED
jgi:hypothetical protein